MSILEFLQDENSALSAGRFATIVGGVLLGFAYILIHPSDSNFSTYMTLCGFGLGVSKGLDTLATAIKGKTSEPSA